MDEHLEHLLKLTDESPIEDLDISVRAFNSLRNEGCKTLGDMKKFYDKSESGKKFRGVGRRTIEEIGKRLEEIDEVKIKVIKE